MGDIIFVYWTRAGKNISGLMSKLREGDPITFPWWCFFLVPLHTSQSCIAFPADCSLSISNRVLCRLLKVIAWIFVLSVACPYLTKMVFTTILIDNGRFNNGIRKCL